MDNKNKKNEETQTKVKRGIIYLATIPPYMNVTRIRETFGEFGKIGRVYLQLADTGTKPGQSAKSKKKKIATKFTEGWVEFERKSIAKRVAAVLNNTQVSTRKKSKQYDCLWSIKYLSHFKWTHLHERLAYEKAARRQKLRAEIELAKKQTNFFTINVDKHKKNKPFVNKDLVESGKKEKKENTPITTVKNVKNREVFLKSLFN